RVGEMLTGRSAAVAARAILQDQRVVIVRLREDGGWPAGVVCQRQTTTNLRLSFFSVHAARPPRLPLPAGPPSPPPRPRRRRPAAWAALRRAAPPARRAGPPPSPPCGPCASRSPAAPPRTAARPPAAPSTGRCAPPPGRTPAAAPRSGAAAAAP